jgi:hypothetical protein
VFYLMIIYIHTVPRKRTLMISISMTMIMMGKVHYIHIIYTVKIYAYILYIYYLHYHIYILSIWYLSTIHSANRYAVRSASIPWALRLWNGHPGGLRWMSEEGAAGFSTTVVKCWVYSGVIRYAITIVCIYIYMYINIYIYIHVCMHACYVLLYYIKLN